MPRNDDAEVARAALAFSRKCDEGAFARQYLELWAPAIRAVLGQLSKRKSALFTFLTSLVDPTQEDSKVELRWRKALRPLARIHPTADWYWVRDGGQPTRQARKHGDALMLKRRRAAMLKVVRLPGLSEAFRAAVVADPQASWTFIEVLAVDGSSDSVDALLPVFERVRRSADAKLIARFAQLREIANTTDAMKELLSAAEALEGKR